MRWSFFVLFFLILSCGKNNENCPFPSKNIIKNNNKDVSDTISLVFMGDVMGHTPVLKSFYNKEQKTYNFDYLFEKVLPLIKNSDYAIANLELTLAGRPFTGYPRFSAPVELAMSCKDAGIQILATANNHSCDRGKNGIIKTINKLDKIGVRHFGTYINKKARDEFNLLILEKNTIKIGLLNYTYGTNGLPIPEGLCVNLIDTSQMKLDIEKSKKARLDKLVVLLHWGVEYQLKPSKEQRKLAEFLYKNGVDVIIGSHPHVIQPMEFKKNKEGLEKLTVFSLGNFISNQRKPNTDGGAIVKLNFVKKNNKTKLLTPGYFLTWVNKFMEKGRNKYQIIPCLSQKSNTTVRKLNYFLSSTRKRLSKNNIGVDEILD